MAHDDLDVICYKVMRYIDAASVLEQCRSDW